MKKNSLVLAVIAIVAAIGISIGISTFMSAKNTAQSVNKVDSRVGDLSKKLDPKINLDEKKETVFKGPISTESTISANGITLTALNVQDLLETSSDGESSKVLVLSTLNTQDLVAQGDISAKDYSVIAGAFKNTDGSFAADKLGAVTANGLVSNSHVNIKNGDLTLSSGGRLIIKGASEGNDNAILQIGKATQTYKIGYNTVSKKDINVNAGDKVLVMSGDIIANSFKLTNEGFSIDKDGSMTLAKDLTVHGNTKLVNLKVSNSAKVGGSLEVAGDSTVSGDSTVAGNSNIQGTLNVDKGLNATGNMSVKGGKVSIEASNTASISAKDVTLKGTNGIALDGDVDAKGNLSVTKDLTVVGRTTLQNGLKVESGKTEFCGDFETVGLSSLKGGANITGKLIVDGSADVSGKLTAGSIDTSGTASVGGALSVGDKFSVNNSGAVSADTLAVVGDASAANMNVTGDVAATTFNGKTFEENVLGSLTQDNLKAKDYYARTLSVANGKFLIDNDGNTIIGGELAVVDDAIFSKGITLLDGADNVLIDKGSSYAVVGFDIVTASPSIETTTTWWVDKNVIHVGSESKQSAIPFNYIGVKTQ